MMFRESNQNLADWEKSYWW